nr:MAG TPA: hypothetical protein [Caudoviricetes sp.]
MFGTVPSCPGACEPWGESRVWRIAQRPLGSVGPSIAQTLSVFSWICGSIRFCPHARVTGLAALTHADPAACQPR